jgi:hypothetical protein
MTELQKARLFLCPSVGVLREGGWAVTYDGVLPKADSVIRGTERKI